MLLSIVSLALCAASVASATKHTSSSSSTWKTTTTSKSTTASTCACTSSTTTTTTTTSPLTCPTGTKEVDTPELITFDDIASLPVGTGTQVPVGYKGLLFQSFFAVNRSLALASVEPHSLSNIAAAGTTTEITDGITMITTNYADTNTSTFDVNSMYVGCTLESDTAVATPAQGCIVTMVGYRGAGNTFDNAQYACSYAVTYNPSSTLGLQQMTYSGQFPSGCKNLTTMIFRYNIYPVTLDAAQVRLGLNLDDINLVTHSCK